MEYILVTGGLGYIGSHCIVELLNLHKNVIIIDNTSNSNISTYDNIKKLTNNNNHKLYVMDLQDTTQLVTIFQQNKITSVIHFAGHKSVNESLKDPLLYYSNNIVSTTSLLQVMKQFNCRNIIFSSSCTVYGQSIKPVTEDTIIDSRSIKTPYGQTKYMIEQILQDIYKSDPEWNIIILRYFNPVSCHSSGVLKEDCKGVPNNLYPYLLKVVTKQYDELQIFGNDYNTPDGTCIRDFIHVVDLAIGHVKSVDKLSNSCGLQIYNLGTGKGTSVFELISTFEDVNKIKLNYRFCGRREGDIDIIYSNVDKAKKELGWEITKTLEDICKDGYNSVTCSSYILGSYP